MCVCCGVAGRTSTLVDLYLGSEFEKCTYIPPAPEPSAVLNCIPHHNATEKMDVLQSSVATCPAQVQVRVHLMQQLSVLNKCAYVYVCVCACVPLL